MPSAIISGSAKAVAAPSCAGTERAATWSRFVSVGRYDGSVPRARANGIVLEYETFGDPKAEPLLLIMGLGAQMITWEDEFCRQLADRGFHVIRFDNRDVGLSTWMEDLGSPDMASAFSGEPNAAYELE